MKRILASALFIFLWASVWGQSTGLDSLERLFDKSTSNTARMRYALEMGKACGSDRERVAYAVLAEEYANGLSSADQAFLWSGSANLFARSGNYTEAVVRQRKANEIYERLGQRRAQADAMYTLGRYEEKALQPDHALTSYEMAEEFFVGLGDIEGQIECLNSRGIIHKELNNYAEALPLYYKAYELARENGLAKKLASTCINIGVVLKEQKDLPEALKYYHKAEEIYLIESDLAGLANIYNNIGNVLRLQKKYDKALSYYELALENRKKSGGLKRLSYTYNNIGMVYSDQKKYKLALEYLSKAEDEKIRYKDYGTLAHTYLNMSEVYLATRDEENYHYYADLASKLARQYSLVEVARDIRVNNSKFEAAKGNYKKAYEHLSTVFDELDTLDAKSQRILTSVLQAHFRDKQTQTELSELSDANTTLSGEKRELEREQRVSRTLIWVLSVVLLVLVITSVMLLRNQRALTEQKRLLEDTNEQLKQTTLGKEEKETLLKEIHHRVKNNLQIIKSLIRLQKMATDDSTLNNILQEFEQRVSSMALVHESLYKSKDLASVNVSSYYENLVNDLIEAYKVGQKIKAEISVNIGGLGLDTLVPLGLLTNEIISNSLKHGFREGENGIITVDLKKIGEQYFELFIGDNGKGFDFEAQRVVENTLGTELILALVEQLDGSYEFINENGAYYRIKFKSQEKGKA